MNPSVTLQASSFMCIIRYNDSYIGRLCVRRDSGYVERSYGWPTSRHAAYVSPYITSGHVPEPSTTGRVKLIGMGGCNSTENLPYNSASFVLGLIEQAEKVNQRCLIAFYFAREVVAVDVSTSNMCMYCF